MRAALPAVSVLIPVFNRERLIGQAIDSVLAQTVPDLEIVVVDDGSTDDTAGTVRSFHDSRVRLIRHPLNLGIPAARNRALQEARGRYIAWLDSDDVARPRRLEIQLRHLERHSGTALVGGCAGKLDGEGRRLRGVRGVPFTYADIRAWLLFRSPFQHSAIMGRADILKRYPYRQDCPVCEDFDLFLRLAEDHRIENLPHVLVDRRLHAGQTVETQRQLIDANKVALLRPRIEHLAGPVDELNLRRHVALGARASGADLRGAEFLDWAELWLWSLREANSHSGVVEDSALSFAAAYFWSKACTGARRQIGTAAAERRRLTSPLARGWTSENALRWLAQLLPTKFSSTVAISGNLELDFHE